MSATLYQLYQAGVMALVQTMTIKHHGAAIAINHKLQQERFTVDWSDPSSWKYYLNLAGVYHPYDLSKLSALQNGQPYMTILVAGDNGPVIAPFTKATVRGNTADSAIANEYRFDSPAYRELLLRYQEFEPLILGILNPIDLSTALKAPDNTILYAGGYFFKYLNNNTRTPAYIADTSVLVDAVNLIEPQEDNLLPKLQHWVSFVMRRWYNDAYSITDDLYYTATLGVLYANAPKVILNIRLANCRTPLVHSYHLKEYLQSNGKLAFVADHLGVKELLYLYRNLRYIEANAGKQNIFDDLINNVATPSNVPMAGYVIEHDLARIEDDLKPTAMMLRQVINFKTYGTGGDHKTVRHILDKQGPLATDNVRDVAYADAATHALADHSLDGLLETKVLESAMIDHTDKLAYPLASYLLNMWLYCCIHGTYTGTLYITHPTTGERLQMTPKNAFIMLIYCANRGYANITPVNIPVIQARNIPRTRFTTPLATLAPYPTQTSLNALRTPLRVTPAMVSGLMGNYSEVYDYYSSSGFHAGVVNSHKELMRRHRMSENTTDQYTQSQLEALMAEFYWSEVPCDLGRGRTYESWLTTQGFDFSDLQRSDYIAMFLSLVKQGTGATEATARERGLTQAAVLAVLRQFTSYGVHYIHSINSFPVIPLLTRHPKCTNLVGQGQALNRIKLVQIECLGSHSVHVQDPIVQHVIPAINAVSIGRVTMKVKLQMTPQKLRVTTARMRALIVLPLYTPTTSEVF